MGRRVPPADPIVDAEERDCPDTDRHPGPHRWHDHDGELLCCPGVPLFGYATVATGSEG